MLRSKWLKLGLILAVVCTWLFWPSSFEPVAGCLKADAWADQRTLLWHYVWSNIGIFLPYMVMPITLLTYVWIRRKEIPAAWFWAVVGFGAFIISCGFTHGTHSITAYHPWFWFEVKLNWVTSAVSCLVAWYLLFPFRPIALGWGKELLAEKRSAEQHANELLLLNEQLKEEKQRAEAQAAALEEANASLQVTRDEAREQAKELDAKGKELAEALVKLEEAKAAAEGQRDAAQQALELRQAQDEAARLRHTVRQLQTPIVPVWEGILLCTIQGVLDSSRANDLMEVGLRRVVDTGARVLLLDLTAVDVVDSYVADHIGKLVRSVGLIGAKCVVCGIRGEVARTMATSGIVLDTERFHSVKDALKAQIK